MYLAGTINSDTIFWKEGQAEWLSVDDLFSPQLITVSGVSSTHGKNQISPMDLLKQSPHYNESLPPAFLKKGGSLAFRLVLPMVIGLIAISLAVVGYSFFEHNLKANVRNLE